VSPERDRDWMSRQLRRYSRDLAEKERQPPARKGRRQEAGRARDLDLRGVEWSDDEIEALPLREKHGRRRSAIVGRHVERLVAPAPSPADAVAATELTATVVATSRGPCEVELPSGEVLPAHLPKALARDDRGVLAVGDRVVVAPRPAGELAVTRRLARSSRLSRPDPFHPHRERVLVANLDLGIVVASLRQPPLSTGLVDRFLVALAHGRIAAAIVVNKTDLAAAESGVLEAAETQLAPYRELDVPLVLCSAREGSGIATLRSLIAGATVAFLGHSGVGKSSLLNALVGGSAAVVGEVSERRGRGRHTTTRARIYRLPDGTRIVDTPGVREFGLWKLTPSELSAYFDEFAPFAVDCRFADCSHVHEPGCAVRAAAEQGAVTAERFATYLRILASFERD